MIAVSANLALDNIVIIDDSKSKVIASIRRSNKYIIEESSYKIDFVDIALFHYLKKRMKRIDKIGYSDLPDRIWKSVKTLWEFKLSKEDEIKVLSSIITRIRLEDNEGFILLH